MIYLILIYSCSRIAYIDVEISRDTKFSNWKLCSALSFFEVVVDIKGNAENGDDTGCYSMYIKWQLIMVIVDVMVDARLM